MKFLIRNTLVAICFFPGAFYSFGAGADSILERSRNPKMLIQHFESLESKGSSKAVVVGTVPLIHTTQVFDAPRSSSEDSAVPSERLKGAFENLAHVLGSASCGWSNVVKLNVYLSNDELRASVLKEIPNHFDPKKLPAVAMVSGKLARGGSLIGLDAVAVGESKINAPASAGKPKDWAVLSPGSRVFISGMADTNALPEATRLTLDKLMSALASLGGAAEHVVQLKAFVQPISDASAVREIIANYFKGEPPPIVLVEWSSPAPNPPIEIELIASCPASTNKSDSVDFLTPAGTSSTKVFSRVARVNHGRLVYFSALDGKAGKAGEVDRIFEELKSLADRIGSDMKHLVKATYYVVDTDANSKLNEVRPRYLDPQRPPAASKAMVTGVGQPGSTVSVDMIAVTTRD